MFSIYMFYYYYSILEYHVLTYILYIGFQDNIKLIKLKNLTQQLVYKTLHFYSHILYIQRRMFLTLIKCSR